MTPTGGEQPSPGGKVPSRFPAIRPTKVPPWTARGHAGEDGVYGDGFRASTRRYAIPRGSDKHGGSHRIRSAGRKKDLAWASWCKHKKWQRVRWEGGLLGGKPLPGSPGPRAGGQPMYLSVITFSTRLPR